MEHEKRSKGQKFIVGLKSHTDYEFRVLATNSLMMSLATSESCDTEWSKAATGGMVVGGSILLSPVAVGIMLDDIISDPSTIKTIAIYSATIPLAPIVVLAVIGFCALGVKEEFNRQNLSPVSDNDEINIRIAVMKSLHTGLHY